MSFGKYSMSFEKFSMSFAQNSAPFRSFSVYQGLRRLAMKYVLVAAFLESLVELRTER